MLEIKKKIIKFNFSSRKGTKIKYLVIHDTGNKKKGAGANNHFIYFGGGYRGQSAHYFVDDKEIIQVVEDFDSAWHVGDGNGHYGVFNVDSLGIEICVNPDSNLDIAEKNAIDLAKHLMKKHNIPVERVIRHYDASRKSCPDFMNTNNWARWHKFKAQLTDSKITDNYFRVREAWDKPSTQIGAFSILATAINLVDQRPTFSVFDSNGNVMYQGRSVIVPLKYARVLKKGIKGEDVKQLQIALTSLKYDPKGIDGSFGAGCDTVIRLFQKNNNLVVDGLVGKATIDKINSLLSGDKPSTPTTTPPPSSTSKSKFYKKGDVSIIETNANNIEIKILGNTLASAKVNGVNGTFYDTPKPSLPDSCWAIATNEGKPLGGNSMLVSYTKLIRRGTIVYYKDNTVSVLRLNNINELKKSHNWAMSGYSVYPYCNFIEEKMPGGIDYKTAHTYIGHKGTQIFLMIKPNCMIRDIIPLVKELKLDGCIVVDGGGSSQLRHPNGSINSTRKINSAVLLKQV